MSRDGDYINGRFAIVMEEISEALAAIQENLKSVAQTLKEIRDNMKSTAGTK